MYVIEVRELGEGGVLVELGGEFDRHSFEDLRETLSAVVALRRPTVLDLSGVTFLDLETTRELTIRSLLYAHHLTLRNPSWQVLAGVRACGFEGWFDFRSGPEGSSFRASPERKPVRTTGERRIS